MPLQATSGAASYDAFGGGAPFEPTYIEQIFQTWLYTGNGSTQTITNGIDLAGKGGLVWTKSRNNAQNHIVNDTVRGAGKQLIPNSTLFQQSESTALTSFNSNGFSLGSKSDVNDASNTYVSWTFREQPKFFDVVTYTGNGASNRNISHALGSVPGAIIIKRTDSTGNWVFGHRGSSGTEYLSTILRLNTTDAALTNSAFSATWTSSAFQISAGGGSDDVNANGATYIVYIFAHNAGGFGLSGTDNVVSCGSVVGAGGSGTTVTLGYEPQWILIKNASNSQDWWVVDNMRGLVATVSSSAVLRPNLSDAETTGFSVQPTSTGFTNFVMTTGQTYIYIAIRRGPMRTPTTGTSVYSGVTFTGDSTVNRSLTAGFPPDLVIPKVRLNTGGSGGNTWNVDRLRGSPVLAMNATFDESVTASYDLGSFNKSQTAFVTGTSTTFINSLGNSEIAWMFRRAPSFFDEVCYTGDGVNGRTVSHNLTVAPELIMVKNRVASADWAVYANGPVGCLILNATNAANGIANFPVGTPTTTTFAVASSSGVNGSGNTFVAYLFASCPGVSKVGSYTGTGTTQTINCGFTGGSRFVMIKRTDSTGDWYVWDSSRGIIAGDDPYLLINSAAIEVTNTNFVDTAATGFQIRSSAPAAINANGGTFIFLAIS
jgi:hypothetical protein